MYGTILDDVSRPRVIHGPLMIYLGLIRTIFKGAYKSVVFLNLFVKSLNASSMSILLRYSQSICSRADDMH